MLKQDNLNYSVKKIEFWQSDSQDIDIFCIKFFFVTFVRTLFGFFINKLRLLSTSLHSNKCTRPILIIPSFSFFQIHHDGHWLLLHAVPPGRRHHLQLIAIVSFCRRNGRHGKCPPVWINRGSSEKVFRLQLLPGLHQVQLHGRCHLIN